MIPVGILGGSGAIGEEYLRLLKNHPWFKVTFIAASDKRVNEMSQMGIPFSAIDDLETAKNNCRLVFSALPNNLAKTIDETYVKNGFTVISHASCHRMKKDVPLIIPEVNPEHLSAIYDKKHFLIAKPNCALLSFVLPLSPLHKLFGIEKIAVTTMQSISGAGISALSAFEIHDNVIPFIADEEEKLETEPLKIFNDPNITISAQCNRVPTLYGHYACTSVTFSKKPTKEEILKVWEEFKGPDLPSSEKQPLQYCEEPNHPQTRINLKPMSIALGRLRSCNLHDFRFVGLSHNTIRGGAGGGVLIAELLYKKGVL